MSAGKFADLHIHTSFSDGSWTPSQAVEYAKKIKLSAIAISDHDSIDGIEEAFTAAKNQIEIIPAIEMSAMLEKPSKCEIHILGYYIDYKSRSLKKTLNFLKEERLKRGYKILEALKGLGIVLKDKNFLQDVKNKALGRLHFAKALVNENFAADIQDAFKKYLARDKAAYIPKYPLSPKKAIKFILKAGGIPIAAHPYFIPYKNKEMWTSLKDDGIAGIEVWHTKHSPDTVARMLRIAFEFDFLTTGGSDCHGEYRDEPSLMGKVKVPYSIVEKLKNAAEEK